MSRSMSRRAPPSRPAATSVRALVVVTPGLEDVLADELASLGIEGTVIHGGVTVSVPRKEIFRIHLWSRVAAGVYVRLGRVKAPTLEVLAQGVRHLPWGDYIQVGQPVEVSASSHSSRVRHRSTIERKVGHAIRDAMRKPHISRGRPPREPARALVRIERDVATVSVDASGDLLHRRGWRRDVGRAPLRENLAAAILREGWQPGTPLVDPMCGSGTFAIEAACWSRAVAPGSRRSFAFQNWPCYRAATWKSLLRERHPSTSSPIFASDRQSQAVSTTRSNAKRAGVEGAITARACDFFDLSPPCASGLMVINPPYGERIGGRRRVHDLYRQMGDTIRTHWSDWRVAILLPRSAPSDILGLPLKKRLSFSNGGIPVGLYLSDG